MPIIAYVLLFALIALCIFISVYTAHVDAEVSALRAQLDDDILALWENEYPMADEPEVGQGGKAFRESPMYVKHLVAKGRTLHERIQETIDRQRVTSATYYIDDVPVRDENAEQEAECFPFDEYEREYLYRNYDRPGGSFI